MTLTGFAVRRPITTAMFFLALSILGVISWSRLPLQLFPELIFPEVFVTFNLNGASAEQVEREMVILAEGEIAKLDGVQVMESYCRSNSGGVRISYAPDTDMKFALLQLQNRMSRLQPLLPERTRVNVQRFDSSDLSATIMQLNVLGDGDLNWLREFAEQKIRPELEAVDGVVSAQVLGGRREAIEIIVDPLMLQAHQLSLSQVRTRINAANQRRQYLGHVYQGNQTLAVSMHEQFQDLQQIQDVVIKPDIPLHLGDIAEVRYGAQTQTDVQRVNGKPSVGIRIQKDDEANLIDVSRAVVEAIDRINKDFASEEIELVVSTSQAEMMEEALNTLKQAAVVGGLLGLFVLFLFLRNFRFVLVLLLAIPASLFVTFNLMYAWDLSLNVLSLCGLALAVGMLTDNGIVVMENIFKHFELGKTPLHAAREGTEEVARAVVAATGTTVTVFLPVIFIQSDAQDILRELALSMTFPLLASLLVALTLVPALSAYTLSAASRPPTGTGQLLERYTVLLKSGLRHRALVTIAIVLVFGTTLVVSFFFMLQQDVRQEESRFTIYASLPEGATLEATDEVVSDVERAVQEVPGLERFLTSVQENQASVTVLLKPLRERPKEVSVEQIKENLDEKFKDIGDAVIGYDAPVRTGRGGGGGGGGGARRSSGGFNLTGTPQTEQAVIRGHDFSILQMLADDLAFRLEELEEVVDPNSVRPDVERSAPEVQVLPDEVMMFDRQLSVQSVLAYVGDARPDGFQTSVPFLTQTGLEVSIDVRTVEDPKTQSPGLQAFRVMPIISPNGHYVPLDEVAHVRTDQGRNMILRTDQSRRAQVAYQFTTEVLDSQPALEEARLLVRSVVQEMVLPEEYSIEIVEAEEENIYYWMMGIAALLIYMILASLFESFSAPAIILCTLPTAIIGSCWALILSGTGLTQQEGPMALLGFIVLLGIAVNNGIMLIDAINTLRTDYGFRRERAVLVAGRSRVRPILMTSATTLLGVLPLALKFGGDYEIWPPFAITVLGGLTVSMISTLIFIPVVYMSLDQVTHWLQQIGLVGFAFATLATGACVYGIDNYYQSLLITCASLLPVWTVFLALVWTLGQVKKARENAKRRFDNITVIQLRNLTKIYGAPGKFKQEWLRFHRKEDRSGSDASVLKRATRDALWWRLPLLALVGYLHSYFDDAVWLYLLGLVTVVLVAQLLKDAILLLNIKVASHRWYFKVGRRALPLLFLVYVHVRLGLVSVTLATVVVYLLAQGISSLSNRVRSGVVDLENMEGRLRGPRGLIYRGAAAVPILGVPKPEFRALAGVDLEISQGMFGLLGPNGAGKTTMMRIICQVLMPSYGSVVVNGQNMLRENGLQGVIGYLPQHFGLYNHMTAFDYLEYRALLEGFRDGHARRNRVSECLEQVNLLDRQGDLIGSFSGGMKQRVGIAQTLLHLPQIIVVDEPTAGLDPLERIRFRNLLARFSQNHIVIFSTHIVEDISGSCNKLGVLNKGKVVYSGTPQDMRDLANGHVWETVVSEEAFGKMERDVEMITHVRAPAGIQARFLADAPVGNAQPVTPSLEDAYLYLLRHGGVVC